MSDDWIDVDFWNVGFGDASVVHLDQHRVAVVDCGRAAYQLPDWLQETRSEITALVLTHLDNDHAGALLPLLKKNGRRVQKWAFLQDRPSKALKRIVREMKMGYDEGLWPYPGEIAPKPDEPQNFIPIKLSDRVRLEAVYPPKLDAIEGQTRGPNWASVLLVLWVYDTPRVAWPGDLPLEMCAEQLAKRKIKPTFLVGPHHGGPEDKDSPETGARVRRIGHRHSWISVAWREDYQLPAPEYLKTMASYRIRVRCSQLTPRCDRHRERFGDGLLATHDWLRLFHRPKSRSACSCMGHMRVRFMRKGFHVFFSKEHQAAMNAVDTPRCRPAKDG